MKLIIIYGPPAVGKLTIAKELSKITGYKLFHNHLTFDLIKPIISEVTSPAFVKLAHKIRLDIFEAAAKQRIKGLIFTFCYVPGKRGHNFIRKAIKIVEKYKGQVYFVKLHCGDSALAKRVKSKSRREFRKIKTIKKLKSVLGELDLYCTIPFKKSLIIDNTKLSAKMVAQKIKKHYRL